jgi:lipocalin
MARSKSITPEQRHLLESIATQLGYDVSKLIYTKQ